MVATEYWNFKLYLESTKENTLCSSRTDKYYSQLLVEKDDKSLRITVHTKISTEEELLHAFFGFIDSRCSDCESIKEYVDLYYPMFKEKLCPDNILDEYSERHRNYENIRVLFSDFHELEDVARDWENIYFIQNL